MTEFRERIAQFSSHLQELLNPEVFAEVQNAVDARDKNAIVEVCRKVKIPEIYLGTIVSVLLAIGPQQKWPVEF